MPGYSGTPLVQKLGIKPSHQVALIGAPGGFEQVLEGLDETVSLTRTLPRTRKTHVIVLFCPDQKALEQRFVKAANVLDFAGGLWVAWPKKSSGVATDLDENFIRAHGLRSGLVDNKVCAITDVWSGLRFVYRVADRPSKTASR